MKDELSAKIMTNRVGLKAKTYSYLKGGGIKDKKAKSTKCVIKRKLKFENYKNCLETTQLHKLSRKKEINLDIIKKDHEEFIKKQ